MPTKNTIDSVIKHSWIIAMWNTISLLQRKLFNYLVGHAYIFLDKQEIHDIKISSLKDNLGFNSKNNDYLKESLKKLISTIVEFNLLWKDKENWSASSLLSSVEFKNGICYYSFSPILRTKLHKPNIYSILNLKLMKVFSSKYTLCLYELVVDYVKVFQTPFIALDTFKKLMWVELWAYDEFKRLKQRVITPSLKELNSVAWFTIALEYKKEWRKIVAIKFLLHEVILNPNKKRDTLDEKIYQNKTLQKSLINDFGLSLRQSNKIIKDYPIPYIKESLQLIKHKRGQSIIKNLPAYTYTVLKNDYVPTNHKNCDNSKKQSILWDTKKSGQKTKSKMARSENNTRDILSHDEHDTSISQNQKKAKEYFESLPKKEQKILIKKFEDERITSDILKTLYKKEGLVSPLFRVMFDNFIIDIKNKF